MSVWNTAESDSLFGWDPQAAWGIRLVHLAGICLRPPLGAKVVRLDGAGQPLSVHILAGDTYDTLAKRSSAVRGLTHELAHALFLWGHSEDRKHILWRCGPIVDEPSPDERRAARLMRLLPAGLDLSRYGRSLETDPPWHQG
jgi:hypothetical protein